MAKKMPTPPLWVVCKIFVGFFLYLQLGSYSVALTNTQIFEGFFLLHNPTVQLTTPLAEVGAHANKKCPTPPPSHDVMELWVMLCDELCTQLIFETWKGESKTKNSSFSRVKWLAGENEWKTQLQNKKWTKNSDNDWVIHVRVNPT